MALCSKPESCERMSSYNLYHDKSRKLSRQVFLTALTCTSFRPQASETRPSGFSAEKTAVCDTDHELSSSSLDDIRFSRPKTVVDASTYFFGGSRSDLEQQSICGAKSRGTRSKTEAPRWKPPSGRKSVSDGRNHAMGMTEQRYRTELPEIHRLPSRLRSNTSSTPQKYTTSDVAGSGTVLNHIVKKPAAERAACRPVV